MNKALTIVALAALPWLAWGQETSADEDFFGEDAETVSTIPTSSVDPTKQFSEGAEGIRWGGTVSSGATWTAGWLKWPNLSNPTSGWHDSLGYNLDTTLFLDGRPDEDFRFRLSLKTGYPFTNTTENIFVSAIPPTTTVEVPNLKVWEMFTDVTIENTVFLRFGKQSASWGVSYFYSPGDVISLTAKDATDPTAEREGPMAMKATVPFPGLKANLTGFVLARDTYFGDELPTLQSLGYALQGDILVGEAQLSLGGFYQRDNAPKAVGTINTGLSFLDLPVLTDINVFSEAVLSYGADVRRGVGSIASTTGQIGSVQYAEVEDWAKTVYYTGTVGASYSNSDNHFSLRAEYLYNPFGSNDQDAAEKGYNGFLSGDLTYGDVAIPGMHNVTALVSISEIAGSDKLSASTFWQQNVSDGSGWVKPTLTFAPWDVLSLTWGFSVVYGGTETQFPLLMQARDKDGMGLGPQRVTFYFEVEFGTGRY